MVRDSGEFLTIVSYAQKRVTHDKDFILSRIAAQC